MYRRTSFSVRRYGSILLALIMLPVYIGPALSGLAAHPLAVLPVYVGLSLLHFSATRKPDISAAVGWAALILAGLIQLAVISFLYLVGWGVGQAVPLQTLPLWLPIGVTGLGVALTAWLFRDAAEMEVFLNSALKKIEQIDENVVLEWHAPTLSSPAQSALDTAIEALKALPQDAGPGIVDPIVNRLAIEAGPDVFDAFYDIAGTTEGRADRRIDLGLLQFVTIPGVRRALLARGDLGLTPMLMITSQDPDIRQIARALIGDMINDRAPLDQLPDPVWLMELEETYPNEGYFDLATQRQRAAARG